MDLGSAQCMAALRTLHFQCKPLAAYHTPGARPLVRDASSGHASQEAVSPQPLPFTSVLPGANESAKAHGQRCDGAGPARKRVPSRGWSLSLLLPGASQSWPQPGPRVRPSATPASALPAPAACPACPPSPPCPQCFRADLLPAAKLSLSGSKIPRVLAPARANPDRLLLLAGSGPLLDTGWTFPFPTPWEPFPEGHWHVPQFPALRGPRHLPAGGHRAEPWQLAGLIPSTPPG